MIMTSIGVLAEEQEKSERQVPKMVKRDIFFFMG
jgi:hypothetical protein